MLIEGVITIAVHSLMVHMYSRHVIRFIARSEDKVDTYTCDNLYVNVSSDVISEVDCMHH